MSAAEADATRVSGLSVPASIGLADTCSSRAELFGVTREIGTLTPYSRPQAWAAAFARAGFGGVRYESRFSTDRRDLAYAVFGASGVAAWRSDASARNGREVAASAGITVLAIPYSLPTVGPST